MRAIAYVHIPFLYTSAHIKLDPGLSGKPVAVVDRNIVIDASPQLLAAGARVGVLKRHARQACPEAIFIKFDQDIYPQFSNVVWDICASYSPLVEPISPSGAFVDLTGCGDIHSLTGQILRRSQKEAGFDVSMGLGTSRLIARVAVPDSGGVRVVEGGSEPSFLSGLPCDALWPLKPQTILKLTQLGVKTVGEISQIPLSELLNQLGEEGLEAHLLSRGTDHSQVQAAYPPESVDHSMSFESPITSWPDLEECLSICAREVARKLMASGRTARVITVSVVTMPGQPDLVLRRTLRSPTDSPRGIATALVQAIAGKITAPISAIHTSATGLEAPSAVQLSIFGTASDSALSSDLERALESIKERFGAESVTTAQILIRTRRDRMLAEAIL
ncbi:MAG: hypothetical protein NUW23_09215 [Firmicutes bacterium]|jgi:DNA polymerase-4|nr:hypothetical protein [Bacillota bacterium]